jgi:hypothetical protein
MLSGVAKHRNNDGVAIRGSAMVFVVIAEVFFFRVAIPSNKKRCAFVLADQRCVTTKELSARS